MPRPISTHHEARFQRKKGSVLIGVRLLDTKGQFTVISTVPGFDIYNETLIRQKIHQELKDWRVVKVITEETIRKEYPIHTE